MDACLMLLSSEADVEQVSTLAEAMQRCLDGRADILFVNMLSTTSRELTALAAFRSLKHTTWVVILASEEMRPVLMSMRIADEVLTATPVRYRSQPQA
jgi:hypothetical protein